LKELTNQNRLQTIKVSDRTEAFRKAVHESAKRRATETSRKKDWKYICEWYSAVNKTKFSLKILPMRPSDIIDFIHDHLGNLPKEVDEYLVSRGVKRKLGPHKLSTILKRLDTIKVMHDSIPLYSESPVIDEHGNIIKGNPCRHTDVEYELKVIKKSIDQSIRNGTSKERKIAKSALAESKKAAQWPVIERLINTCDDSLKGIRDKALFLYSYSTGRRRSETANQFIEDITNLDDGFLIAVPPSKQTAYKEIEVFISGEAAEALKKWLDKLEGFGVTSGKLFRSIRKGGKSIGESISGTSINNIVKERMSDAGFSKEEINAFSSHSFRSGFATDAKVLGIPPHQARQFSGQSAQTFEMYAKETNAKTNETTSLIEKAKIKYRKNTRLDDE